MASGQNSREIDAVADTLAVRVERIRRERQAAAEQANAADGVSRRH
jgi:hypothetical protein